MRCYLEELFKEFFHEHLMKSCATLKLSKTAAARNLQMSYRSYSALEAKENGCSSLTLALFLINMCENPLAFLSDLANTLKLVETQLIDPLALNTNLALSYRLPMSVREIKRDVHGHRHAVCPRCGSLLDHTDKHFCDHCGQHLDWNSFPGAIVNH